MSCLSFSCLFEVFCLLAFIFNVKVNIIAWQYGDWLSSLGFCCLNYLTYILGGYCIYVNGIFKEKECFCIFTVFLWKAFHDCQFETGKIHVMSAYSVFLSSSSNFEPGGCICRSECYCPRLQRRISWVLSNAMFKQQQKAPKKCSKVCSHLSKVGVNYWISLKALLFVKL